MDPVVYYNFDTLCDITRKQDVDNVLVNQVDALVPGQVSHPYILQCNIWWIKRVTLVVAFGVCPKILGGSRDLQMMVLLEIECSLSDETNGNTVETNFQPFCS